MVQPTDVLRSFLRGSLRVSGLRSISVYIPATGPLVKGLFLHEGSTPPIVELSEIERAESKFVELDADPTSMEGRDPEAHLTPSCDADGWLIRMPPLEALLDLADRGRSSAAELPLRRRRSDESGVARSRRSFWIGLRFGPGKSPFSPATSRLSLSLEPSQLSHNAAWWGSQLAMGGLLAWPVHRVAEILSDPVTGLPGRLELHRYLSQTFAGAQKSGAPLSLLLVNPDDYALVNERFGRDAGDEVLQDVVRRLRAALRESDLVAKYGGAIFAAVLIGTDAEGGRTVAEKLVGRLTEGAYLGGALRLGFSQGVASFDPSVDEISGYPELLRRADQALNAAKRSGGGDVALWQIGFEEEEQGSLGQLSGIFTGNVGKDYRNMALLLETVGVVAGAAGFDDLARQVVLKLASSLRARRVALFECRPEGALRLVASAGEGGPKATAPSDEERSLVERARREGRIASSSFQLSGAEQDSKEGVHALPLMAGGECFGCIYLRGRGDTLLLDTSDRIFLAVFASQLAVALDRARLTEEQQKRQRQEQERLRAEVDQLRRALQQAKLEYRSEEMATILATVRRVAPTDATVLITGESGTGKELIAQAVHQLSTRSEKPMVVVDCGAIPASLIESELFGREKGAYTGADRKRLGRLVEAHEGTVLLDEIGELPLEVQAKLLRFVQERQLTPVGASRARQVDVRLIAATNRDLKAEVQAGRFREDLYYRLHVVRVSLPPLRQRPSDILHLAHHYLRTYAVLYHKQVERFTPEAESLLLAQSWPGNVRELQHCVQQAVILSEGSELGARELGLDSAVGAARGLPPVGDGVEAAVDRSRAPSRELLLEELRAALVRHIQPVIAGQRPVPPLGRWLGDDLILEADRAGVGVATRAAALVGIPESTFRRRRSRAAEAAQSGLSRRPASWSPVRRLIADLLALNGAESGDLMATSQRLLLREVLSHVGEDVRTGARLMSVTPPTFRRRRALLTEVS